MPRNKLPGFVQLACGALAVAFSSQLAIAGPKITFDRPTQNERHSGTSFLDVEGLAIDPIGLRSIIISLNDRPLSDKGQRGIELRERIIPKLEDLQGVERFPIKFRVPVGKLKDGANSMTFRVENLRGEVSVAHRSFVYAAPRGTIYVAAIGINRYQDMVVPPLKYAEDDALAVADYFQNHLGVPSENIFTLVGREATVRNIKKLLGVTLQRKAGQDDQVVIYYAGHGVPEFDSSLSEGDQVEKYLLPWDGEADGLYATALPMREVDYLSRRFKSERVAFILDTCFSGSASERNTRARTVPAKSGLRSFGRYLDDGFLKRMAAATGKIILTASGINEPSHEIDELGHGVFTYYLLEGLKGQADLDTDGVVDVSEIYKYLTNKVPARTGHSQTPTYFISETVVGEIILGRSGDGGYSFDIRDPWAGVENDGRLALQANPADADIFINGASRLTRRGFINTTLRAGRHRIKVQKPGYKTVELEQPISKHEISELHVNLEPVSARRLMPRPPPPP
jgi:hypothetical protein